MIMQELQLQVTQGACQSVAPVSGMSAPFSSQGAPPSPIQTFLAQQHQQPHQMSQQSHLFGRSHHPQIQGSNHMSPQQQAYAMRLAKDRRRRLLHQQQQFSGSNAVTPSQNSPQISQQSQSSAVTSISSSQVHNKQQNVPRNTHPSGGMPNQMINQRERQQLHQQQPRHQQLRQQPQQQGNLLKGLGGGNTSMYQNVSVDASHVNAPSAVTSNKVNERHLLQQGQGLFSGGSASGSALPQSSSQQKIYLCPLPRSPKSVPAMSAHTDACNQSPVKVPPNHSLMTSQQSSLPPLPLVSQQQQRQTNHSQQAMQRMMLQQNHHINPDGQVQTIDPVQVNQLIVTTSASQCTDPGNAISVATSPMSTSHWKPEPSYDATVPAPTVQLATSPQHNLVGSESTVAPPSQGLTKRPFSGSLPMHVHAIGGQWQQPKQPQQQPPQDQQKQQHQPPQQHHHHHQQQQPSQHPQH